MSYPPLSLLEVTSQAKDLSRNKVLPEGVPSFILSWWKDFGNWCVGLAIQVPWAILYDVAWVGGHFHKMPSYETQTGKKGTSVF